MTQRASGIFVVIHHTGIDKPHYDLLIDNNSRARVPTWRLPVWPIERVTKATRLPDHRRHYLRYSGPISDDRGHVQRVDGGMQHSNRRPGHWVVRFFRHTPGCNLLGLELTKVSGEIWEAKPVEHSRRRPKPRA